MTVRLSSLAELQISEAAADYEKKQHHYTRVPEGIRILALIHLHSDPKSWEEYLD